MKNIILLPLFLMICTSCTTQSGMNSQSNKEITKAIVSEPVPGMNCKCIDTKTNCKEIINRKFECSNTNSNDLPQEKTQKSTNNETIVSEPIPGANCTCIDTQTNCKEVINRKYKCTNNTQTTPKNQNIKRINLKLDSSNSVKVRI